MGHFQSTVFLAENILLDPTLPASLLVFSVGVIRHETPQKQVLDVFLVSTSPYCSVEAPFHQEGGMETKVSRWVPYPGQSLFLTLAADSRDGAWAASAQLLTLVSNLQGKR